MLNLCDIQMKVSINKVGVTRECLELSMYIIVDEVMEIGSVNEGI